MCHTSAVSSAKGSSLSNWKLVQLYIECVGILHHCILRDFNVLHYTKYAHFISVKLAVLISGLVLPNVFKSLGLLISPRAKYFSTTLSTTAEASGSEIFINFHATQQIASYNLNPHLSCKSQGPLMNMGVEPTLVGYYIPKKLRVT